MLHSIVGRTLWSAAGPLAGLLGLSSTVISGSRGTRADQGVRPTIEIHQTAEDPGGIMLRTVSLSILLLTGAHYAAAPNQLSPEEKKEGYVLLFNGRNLDGWDGDPAAWSVEDGAIVGTTDQHPVKQNTFLIYKTKYA